MTVLVAGLLGGCSTDSSGPGDQATRPPGTVHPPAPIPSPVGEPPLPSDTQDHLQSSMTRFLPELSGTPAVFAAVWQPDRGAWATVVGWSDPGPKEPPRPNHHLRIGTLTATFTDVLVRRLADQGRLDLDTPIGPWFPALDPASVDATITVRQLLDGSSGLADYADTGEFEQALCATPDRVYQPDELVRMALALPRAFAPGQGRSFSRTNAAMLGQIIEQVTGNTFADAVRTSLLEPLGLGQTSVPAPTDAAMVKPYAHGFTTKGTCREVDASGWNPSWAAGAGDMISNLQDLQVWAYQYETGGRIAPAAATGTTGTTGTTNPAGTTPTATGLGAAAAPDVATPGWRTIDGTMPGYTSSIAYDPSSDTLVVVVATSDLAVGGVAPATLARQALVAAVASDPGLRPAAPPLAPATTAPRSPTGSTPGPVSGSTPPGTQPAG